MQKHCDLAAEQSEGSLPDHRYVSQGSPLHFLVSPTLLVRTGSYSTAKHYLPSFLQNPTIPSYLKIARASLADFSLLCMHHCVVSSFSYYSSLLSTHECVVIARKKGNLDVLFLLSTIFELRLTVLSESPGCSVVATVTHLVSFHTV